MSAYRIGQLYDPDTRRHPEGQRLRISATGAELTLFWARPEPEESAAVHAGDAQFAWVDTERVAVLLARFGPDDDGWVDCPYHPTQDPGAAPPAAGQDLLVQVVLVDADTGTVAALRSLTWPPGFARRVAHTVNRLLIAPADTGLDGVLDALYARYPHADDLLLAHGVVRCAGGVPG